MSNIITGADQILSETFVIKKLFAIARKINYLKKSRNYQEEMMVFFLKLKQKSNGSAFLAKLQKFSKELLFNNCERLRPGS